MLYTVKLMDPELWLPDAGAVATLLNLVAQSQGLKADSRNTGDDVDMVVVGVE